MDGQHFDALTRVAAGATSRRTTLGAIVGAALAAGISTFDLAGTRKGKGKGKGKNKKKKRCHQFDEGCGKQKCCKGLTCNTGVCVPSDLSCTTDADCEGNFVCDGRTCQCPAGAVGECVHRCDVDRDCPGNCECGGLFPGAGVKSICIDMPLDACDGTIACDDPDECPSGFVCAFTTCDDPEGSGRCLPITCRDEPS